MSTKPKIQIILGTTRPSRFGEKPARFLADELAKREDVESELLDLAKWPLPFFDAPVAPARANGAYEHDAVKRWSAKINEGDGYIIVTPEYNHGYPGVLKNALDWLFPEWSKKPVGFVSYGNAGGARAIEQLRQVVIELDMLPIRDAIHLPLDVYVSMMKEQVPVNPELFKPIREGWAGDRVKNLFDSVIALAVTMKATRKAP